MSTEKPILSIVCPAYGEADHLEKSLRAIRKRAAALKVPYEIVVVDDGSADDTWRIVERLAMGSMPEVQGVSLARNFGKHPAILAGLDTARGDAVIIMDCDLQHPPALIPKMFALWRDDGYKVVNAQKAHRGRESVASSIGARAFYRVFERLARVRLADTSDFKLLDREVVDIYRRLPERSMFFRGLISWMGFDQIDIPFEVEERSAGRSKWSWWKRFNLAAQAITSFSAVPLQFVTLAGLLFLGLAVLLAGHTIYMKIAGQAIEGFTTVILLLLVIGSVLMLSLGVIGQYLAHIYEELKSRPRYLVKERIIGGKRSWIRSVKGDETVDESEDMPARQRAVSRTN